MGTNAKITTRIQEHIPKSKNKDQNKQIYADYKSTGVFSTHASQTSVCIFIRVWLICRHIYLFAFVGRVARSV